MLGIRHYWDAANLHNHATVRCGLISSHKLSQVRLGQSFDWEAFKNNVQVLQEVLALIHQVALFWVGSAPAPLQGAVLALYVWVALTTGQSLEAPYFGC